MIKSPLRYPGGKSRAVKLITSLITSFDEYREPFVGGGSVYIKLKQLFPVRKYWINDIYQGLYYFWFECQKDVTTVINRVRYFKDKFQTGKELYKYLIDNIAEFDTLDKAAAFFVFNRITFSGTSESGGYSEQSFTGRFTESSIQRLVKFGEVIQNTNITNLDYQNVIEIQGNNVFIFLDPPYYSASKSSLYGKNGNLHKGFDHARFAETMKKCKHKFLITYDDSEYIRNLFSFARIIPWELTYGMRNIKEESNQIGKELFISNYLDEIPSCLKNINQTTIFDSYAIN